ncbi:MAG: signal peptide peptidase SppA [Candidatus Syntrophonatronum acetioxidans]|uniref:Signal peptide peptidase SppA n=1 Tax=Candidatus Syntrophonatronum acetioxidans TaxID=1795816 RepID=A0A424YFU8_9FIRM|nr:MAG: signal peptide peptidase SppA [Candidatus Syntrophonatronum acetioxidans]
MKGKKIFITLVVVVTVLALGIILRDVFLFPEWRDITREEARRGRVGLIYVEGTILAGRGQGGLMGAPGMDPVLKQLQEARLDPQTRAVVLRVNSPGGSAAASQEIHREISKIREEGKPVVVSMADVAASGGYYISVAADKIMANPGTTTGSIGVIMQFANLEELYEKLGVDFETIKSGEYKDMGDPGRSVTPEEREVMQAMADDVFDQFVEAVAQGREMSREEVLEVADGRVFTGRQALDKGLIDDMGDLYDAVDAAARLANLEDPQVKDYTRVSPWSLFWSGGLQEETVPYRLLEGISFYNIIRGVEKQ